MIAIDLRRAGDITRPGPARKLRPPRGPLELDSGPLARRPRGGRPPPEWRDLELQAPRGPPPECAIHGAIAFCSRGPGYYSLGLPPAAPLALSALARPRCILVLRSSGSRGTRIECRGMSAGAALQRALGRGGGCEVGEDGPAAFRGLGDI